MAIEVDFPDCLQENGKYMSGKHFVRNNKMPLDRFMALANITSTSLDNHDIVFPELYEIYAFNLNILGFNHSC
jgi:hypothetical protein